MLSEKELFCTSNIDDIPASFIEGGGDGAVP